MGKFFNSYYWVGDLTLFEALAGGTFDHLNCPHTGEFDQNFSKSQMPGRGRGGHGRFWN